MKNSIILILSIFPLLGMSGNIPKNPSDSNQYILRITSEDPGEEIFFEGAYILESSSNSIKYIKQKTPFTITFDSKLFYGFFQRTSGKANLEAGIFDPKENNISVDGENSKVEKSHGKGSCVWGSSKNAVVLKFDKYQNEKDPYWTVRTF